MRLETPAGSSAQCVSEETIAAFAEGHLDQLELESLHDHLDGCHVCQTLVLDAVRGSAFAVTKPDDGAPAADWNTTFRRGELVGQRYRIKRFIARGGMGEVYEAFDCDLTERVALKTVASTASDNPNAVRRLKAEVQLARRVSHPNVCRIYDLGSHAIPNHEAQIDFLTMEFVEGRTLGQRIRSQKKLCLAEATDIARQLLMGLGAAHDAGILHRDFKSDNVMLRASGDGRIVAVILDFGLARSLNDGPRASHSNQQVVGTIGYIAPEHFRGNPFTPASDVYSFGVVLYEMLTGERPSADNSALRDGTGIEPPSRLNPEVPAALDALVLGCLHSSPAQRFQTSHEVLERLDQLVRRPPAFGKRRRALSFALGALSLAVLFAAVESARPQRALLRAPPLHSHASALLPRSVSPPSASVSGAAEPSATPRVRTSHKIVKVTSRGTAAPSVRNVAALEASAHPPTLTDADAASAPEPAPSAAKPRWENPFSAEKERND
jgi:serine/threonine protein kinase